MEKIRKISIFILTAFVVNTIIAQKHDTLTFDCNKRKKLVYIAGSSGYVGTMAGLYGLWYAGYPHSKFHVFNDNAGWQHMDKFGHATTAYFVGKYSHNIFKWSCMDSKKAIWLGGGTGWFFLTTVELFDGISKEWGFSWGDMAFNTMGAGLFIGQELLFKEQRILLKFSYHNTQYAQYMPNKLGSNFSERLLKDYNGQTYWLSMNIYDFTKAGFIPKWLNLSLGYSAEGMLTGYGNPEYYNGKKLPHFDEYPQYFLSLDIDFFKIETKNKWLSACIKTLGFIKIPFPAIEYSKQHGIKGHWLYF